MNSVICEPYRQMCLYMCQIGSKLTFLFFKLKDNLKLLKLEDGFIFFQIAARPHTFLI